jgi:cytochrome c55X
MPDLRGILFGTGLALTAMTSAAWAQEVPAARAAELEHILIQDCGSCHGLTMKGGLGSPLTAEALDGADPETLAYIILEGVPGTAMPPWRPLLTDDEALWIAQYLLKMETQK